MLFDPSNPQAFWLDVTNAALGVFVGVCLLALMWGVGRELVYRMRRHSIHLVDLDPHTLHEPGLGMTMADGGRPSEDDRRSENEKSRK